MYAAGAEAWSAFVKELGTVGGCRGRKGILPESVIPCMLPPKGFEKTSFIFLDIR